MATPLFPLTMVTPLILVQLFITNGDYPVFALYTKMATPLVPLDVLAPVESLRTCSLLLVRGTAAPVQHKGNLSEKTFAWSLFS